MISQNRRGFVALAGAWVAGVVGLKAQQAPVTLAQVEEHVRQAALPPPVVPSGSCSCPSRRIQTTLDLYSQEPRGWEAVQGWGTSGYSVPGSAYSANGRSLCFGYGLAPIIACRWLVIWNPQGDPRSAIRLDTLWNTPSLFMGEISGHVEATPICSALDVTAKLQQLQAAGQSVYLQQQLRGNPIIFGSVLEIIWDMA